MFQVRLAIGNGLRPDVWPDFQARFGIRLIGEFYASTEGNIYLFNNKAGATGAVGHLSRLVRIVYNIPLVRINLDSEELVRDEKTGRCVPCAYGEVGEALGLIDAGDPTRQFHGYTDESATQEKIVANVLRSGDCYFRSGDLLRMDANGFYFFVDRIGDTFRWQGENVATSEVSECCTGVDGVQEATIYGVTVPGRDGRAGMAALVLCDQASFAFSSLYRHVARELPAYAQPVFVRIMPAITVTATFKHQKRALAQVSSFKHVKPAWSLLTFWLCKLFCRKASIRPLLLTKCFFESHLATPMSRFLSTYTPP